MRMLADLTGMQLYCMQIGRLADAGKLSPTVAGLAKMNNTRKARKILSEARDLLGGNGILQENHVSGTWPTSRRSTRSRAPRRCRP